MIKFLIGGSPCTHWSIARQNRETEPRGVGWELFKNYLIAREKFRPDFFLYENNKSAAPAIKERIAAELGAPLQYINSALVSAQNRERFYCHNFGDVPPPTDRGIILQDILESGMAHKEKAYTLRASGGNKQGNSNLIRHIETDGRFGYMGIAEPVRIGTIESAAARPDYDSRQYRVYSPEGKAVTISGEAGGAGAITGLYACPADAPERRAPVYAVRAGRIEIKGRQYPIKLPDGLYIIRKLTVTECCRLQTLPDDYCRAVSPTQAYRGLGNGWTAEVIIHLISHALRGVPQDAEITVLSMYDGIGTGRYCFDALGFKNVTYYAYEIDGYAMRVAQSNFPDIIQRGDAYAVRQSGWRL